MGDVFVEVDDIGATVVIEGMWHGHFDDGSPEEIVAECAGFLQELFADRLVVWVARRGGRVLGGGTFLREGGPGSFKLGTSREPDEVRAQTWSGPWVDESART